MCTGRLKSFTKKKVPFAKVSPQHYVLYLHPIHIDPTRILLLLCCVEAAHVLLAFLVSTFYYQPSTCYLIQNCPLQFPPDNIGLVNNFFVSDPLISHSCFFRHRQLLLSYVFYSFANLIFIDRYNAFPVRTI